MFKFPFRSENTHKYKKLSVLERDKKSRYIDIKPEIKKEDTFFKRLKLIKSS